MPYDSLLKIFVSTDTLRLGMMQPNSWGDNVFATDAHAVLVVPKSLLENTYTAHPRCPNLSPVWDKTKILEQPFTIPTEYFLSVMKQIPKVYDSRECKDCDGNGEIECESCGHCEECEQCGGKGYIVDSTLPKVYPFEDDFIKIGNSLFTAELMGKLEAVLLSTKEKTFELVGASDHKQHLFKVGELQVLMMPILKDDPSGWKTHELFLNRNPIVA